MEADEVARQASSEAVDNPLGIRMEVQKFPSIEEFHTFAIQGSMSWMTPLISYLKDGYLPSDPDEARKIKKRATRYTLLNDAFYKRGFSLPYLKCVEEDEARYMLEEVHKGICGDYSGPRSLISKITKVGHFWPIMRKEVKDFVKTCDKCQKYGNVQRTPGEKMTIITSPWPFAQWRIDIVGPLP